MNLLCNQPFRSKAASASTLTLCLFVGFVQHLYDKHICTSLHEKLHTVRDQKYFQNVGISIDFNVHVYQKNYYASAGPHILMLLVSFES